MNVFDQMAVVIGQAIAEAKSELRKEALTRKDIDWIAEQVSEWQGARLKERLGASAKPEPATCGACAWFGTVGPIPLACHGSWDNRNTSTGACPEIQRRPGHD